MSIEDRYFYVGPDDDPDKYRLLASVGRGGEAELWEADMVVAGGRERVAVKILHDDHSADVTRWKSRWAEQVELLRLISHPGVVGVHAYFDGPRMHQAGQRNSNDRALYMVMNWIDGQDLRDWVPQHTKPEARRDAMRYLAQIAGILDWLHNGATPSRRPLVHGDISPANIIINRDRQAVLVDFGLIRVARHVTTVAAGTPGYTAPEIARGGEYSPASDRYAFGGLAYYVLTGTHPPEDPRRLHAGLSTIAGFADQPATVTQLATIFSADPAARPSCADWLRNLRLHSSTAPVRPAPLPPLAPGGANPLPASTVPERLGQYLPRRALAILGGFLAAVVLAVTVTNLFPWGASPASDGTANNQPSQQETSGGSTTTASQSPPSQPPTSQPGARQSITAYLTTLEPVNNEGATWETGVVKIDGHEYAQGIWTDFRCDSSFLIEYALSGRYTRLRGTAGFEDNTQSTTPSAFKVYLDNTVALTGTIRLRKPIKIDLDLRGVVRLGILIESDPAGLRCDNPGFALGDLILDRQS